jgi:hypothetical protein
VAARRDAAKTGVENRITGEIGEERRIHGEGWGTQSRAVASSAEMRHGRGFNVQIARWPDGHSAPAREL